MKCATILAAVTMTASLAACSTNPASSPQNGMAGQNTTESMAPANDQASKPGNSGNGLGYGMTPADADRVFDFLDTNHDGFVDRSEFMVNGDSGQRFPGCDVDGDGKLTRMELERCAAQPATNSQ